MKLTVTIIPRNLFTNFLLSHFSPFVEIKRQKQ